MQFQSLNIIEPILRSLYEEGYTEPTPIQVQAIPLALKGGDLLGCAQTGTGKTAAFAIPILQHIYANKTHGSKRKLQSLILTPTRELAHQIFDSFNTYGKYTGINCTVVYGGVSQNPQAQALRRGVDILIATPGRLLDLLNQRLLTLRDIKYFVLDEADRMLDMGFIHDIKKIAAQLPSNRQTLFFSATIAPEIISLAGGILNHPVMVQVDPPASTVDTTRQFICYVEKKDKNALLMEVLKDRKIQTALVFTRTKHGADKVVKSLIKNNIRAEAIHGNKTQNARQHALDNFKSHKTRVLVATDIAARGIDVDNLGMVINYEIPNIAETYVHRIGRTGRAGANGTALSFCDREEKAWMRDIEKLIHKKIPIMDTERLRESDQYTWKKTGYIR